MSLASRSSDHACHAEAACGCGEHADAPTRAELETNGLAKAYVEPLLAGDRAACRKVIEQALAAGITARELLNQLIWPTMELLQALYKEDRITISQVNLATRLNRSTADQLCGQLERKESNGKKVLIFCGNAEPEELGGQICADLFEADGYQVRFAGGGVPEDEVLKLIGEYRPELLLMFATPLFAGFVNVLMPLQIGAPDVAFPRLNALAYWLYSLSSRGTTMLLASLPPNMNTHTSAR